MAKRTFTTSITYTAGVAQGTAPGSGQYAAIMANTTGATQVVHILELVVQGQSTASAIFGGCFSRASTNATGTLTALAAPNSDGFNYPNASALTNPPNTFIAAATTQPTPSSTTTDLKFPLTINAFGGLYRENFAPGQEITCYGAAAPTQQALLYDCSGYGGAACAVTQGMIYEPD